MTPKEKAISLVHKFCAENQYYERAQQCALIMVDELLTNSTFLLSNGELYFWNQVKQEIEKL